MRILMTMAIAAVAAAGPVAAQTNTAAPANAPASGKSAEAKKADRDDQKVVCKRTHSGKVCMTEQKWKNYEDIM